MRYTALILGVLFSHVVSAGATEVLLKARDQATANWAKEVSKKFHATVKRLIPGLNAVILRVPTARCREFCEVGTGKPGDLRCRGWRRLSTTF